MKLLAAVALVAAVSSSVVAAAAPPKTLAAKCGDPKASGTVVRVGKITAAVSGSGSVGIVLANTADGQLCDWVFNESRLVGELQSAGYRIALFDYSGASIAQQTADMVAVAGELRSLGAKQIVLAGGSIGGVVALRAAALVRPAAVFGLSASSDRVSDGKPAAESLHVPLLLVAARQDPDSGSSKLLYRAAGTKHKQLLLVPGRTHAFFDLDPAGPRVDAAVLAFLRANV